LRGADGSSRANSLFFFFFFSGSGEASVELSTAEEVSKALGKDKAELRDQTIAVTKAASMGATGTEQQEQQQGQQGQGPAEQGGGSEQGALRLRGLPYSATKDDILVRACVWDDEWVGRVVQWCAHHKSSSLRNPQTAQSFFSAFKVAADGVHIMMDHTGRPSGQALVVFETSADAQEATRLDKEKIGAWAVWAETDSDAYDLKLTPRYVTSEQAAAGSTSSRPRCRRRRWWRLGATSATAGAPRPGRTTAAAAALADSGSPGHSGAGRPWAGRRCRARRGP